MKILNILDVIIFFSIVNVKKSVREFVEFLFLFFDMGVID